MSMPGIRVVLVAALLAPSAHAGEPAPLFAEDSVLDVRIEAPIRALMDVRPDKAYLKGTFIYAGSDGVEQRVPLKLRTRGNYRRDKSHCDFAPILLNFPKDDVVGTLLDGQNKLKLVTHCRSFEHEFEFYLLREYLAYRLFETLSDISYGVRLLRITYADSENGKEFTRYGFVIEDDKAVARRNDLKLVKVRHIAHDAHVAARQNLVHVFQYMIGNTEYTLITPEPGKNCCHNVDLLSATKEPPYIALPFDFDFSGLVNSKYAQPSPRYPINSVRTRYYKGRCENNEMLPATLELFRDRRAAIMAVIDEIASNDKKTERAIHPVGNYVDKFFELIENPDEVQKRLVERCLEASTED